MAKFNSYPQTAPRATDKIMVSRSDGEHLVNVEEAGRWAEVEALKEAVPNIERNSEAIEENRAEISKLKEDLADYSYINYPYPFTHDSTLIGSDGITKFYTQKKAGINFLEIIEGSKKIKHYFVQTFYATASTVALVIRGGYYDGSTPFYVEYVKPRAEAENSFILTDNNFPDTKMYVNVDWSKVNAGYGQNLTEFSARIQEQCIVRNTINASSVLIVDKNGHGLFKTIQSAVDAAKDGDVIYIKSGWYEESVSYVKQIALIGENKKSTVLFNATGEYSTPPLWTCSGKIENLTVYAWNRDGKNFADVTRLGYAMHLDQKWDTNHDKRHIEIRNCIFKSDFSDAIGCGVDADAYIDISDTICEATKKSGMKVHPFPTTGTSKILLRNNVFKKGTDSNAYGLMFHTGGTDGTHFNVIEVEAYNNVAKTYDGWDNNCFKMNEYNYGNTLAGMNRFAVD